MSARRSMIIAAGLTLFCFSGLMLAYRWMYPYGLRTCYLPCVVSALATYAVGHEDCFPDGGSTPQEALRKLTPNYVPVSLLAGISGDIAKLEATLDRGGEIGDFQSSWVYFPGFKRTDEPTLAIIWERVGGVKFNGRRAEAGSHAVGFADGTHRQIPAAEWDTFLQRQSSLRDEIKKHRNERTTNRTEPAAGANHEERGHIAVPSRTLRARSS